LVASISANGAGVDDQGNEGVILQQRQIGLPLDVTCALTNDQWRHILAVNLDSVFYVVRAALRIMLPQGSGAISICPRWGV
jgi:NAD(P)-dependent dehydrogenase (short-subunit alcohol dehydrogenase family)